MASLLAGILRTVETSAKGRENHMKDALQDLEALRVKAKDMVKIAAELNEKLTATTSSNSTLAGSSTTTLAEPEEATFIRSSLSQLGLQISNTSVTLDMMKDERNWFDELARELARVLQGPPNLSNDGSITGGMMKNRGIIALDEVWGGWNRARGVGAFFLSHERCRKIRPPGIRSEI
jgi:ESCRT-II complex subunit VPS36